MNDRKKRIREIADQVSQYAHGLRYPRSKTASKRTFLSTPRSNASGKDIRHRPAPTPFPKADSGVSTSVKESRHEQLKALSKQIMECTKCPLHQHRIQAVPGGGVLDPDVMVIGEAPGANEDKHGKPFIGRSGQYLDKWLEAIGIYRTKNAYIANIIKCRPPQNRDPLPAEISHCKPYLEQQIELISPKVLLIAGRIAAHHLFNISDTLATMRTQQYSFQNTPTLVTYHPSAVLRNPNLRKLVWEDMQKLKNLISEQ